MTFSNASVTVGIVRFGIRISSPLATRLALRNAWSLAMARETMGNDPRPITVGLASPAMRIDWDQVLLHSTFAVFLTRRLSPWPPRPSPKRPGQAIDLTNVCVSFLGRSFSTITTPFMTLK